MQDNPLVSIIINNYNYDRFLQSAIDSALNQNYPNIEVILVDDGSTDNSRQIIASYGNKIIPVLKENGGQASAFNAGFAASRGEIICFLDSDDLFFPEKIAEVVDVFARHPDIGWCFHHLRLVDTNYNILPQEHDYNSSGEYDMRSHLKKGKLRNRLPCIPATSGLCFKSSLLQLILPMPENIVILSDNYLKFVALGLTKGFCLCKELSFQIIHGNNACTRRRDRNQVIGKIHILTAYWLRIKLPNLDKFSNNVLAEGINYSWRAKNIDDSAKLVLKKYLSTVNMADKINIYLRAIYNYLKK